MIVSFLSFLAAVILCLLTGRSLLWALLFGLALFFVLGLRRGFGVRPLWEMAWKKGRESLIVIPVFLLIGTVTALWRSAGTISFFLYYGLRGVKPSLFLLTAFLLSAALSFTLGTSYGVTGTAGIVLIALARSGGVSATLTAGAILSGAYFGDRCSPISSCATLVAAVTGTELYRNVREMLKTAALPTLLTALFYWVLSVQNPIGAMEGGELAALRGAFSLRLAVLLPVVLILLLPLCRIRVYWAMAASAAAAFLVTVFLQGQPAWTALKFAVLGYVPARQELAGILSGGGIVSMLPASAIVFTTSLSAGILEGLRLLTPLRSRAERLAERVGLFPATILVSTLIVMVFCNQSVMVLMDGQLLGGIYEARGVSHTGFAMDIANSGVTIAGLVPWSIAITVPLAMLNVGLSAIPFAALLYLIPLCYLFTRRFNPAARSRPIPCGKDGTI